MESGGFPSSGAWRARRIMCSRVRYRSFADGVLLVFSWGFFDPERRNGSRGRSPSMYIFPVAAKFNWRDAGLGIRVVSSIQIGETAREAAWPPGVFFRVPQSSTAGCRPRHPRGFFDPDPRNGSRGRSPSRCFFRVPQVSTGGMLASASARFLRSSSEKRLARPLALQVIFQVAAKFNWRDAGLGIRGGGFDPERRNGSRGRSPSMYIFPVAAKFNWRDAGLGIRGRVHAAYADPATKDPAKPRCPMRDRRFRGSQ